MTEPERPHDSYETDETDETDYRRNSPHSARAYAPPPENMLQAPRRLSLRTLVVHPVRQLGSLIVPLAALLFVGGALDSQRVIVFPLVILFAVAFSLLRWATFTYRVREDKLEIAQGVLNRQTRSIPLDRIRGVDVTASPLHRLLGIAVVRVDAAAGGETQQEGELDAVTAAEAELLRASLLRRATQAREPAGAEAGPQYREAGRPYHEETEGAESVILARLKLRWYLYAPLTAYLFVPLAVLGAGIGFLIELGGRAGALSEENLRRAFEVGAAMPYILAAAGGALFLVAAPLVAIGAFALTNWNFTLRRRGGSIVGERGLLSRRSVSLERERIRGWDLREGLLQRTAGAAGLRALVTGLGDVENRADLLPIAPRTEALAAADRAVGPFHGPLLDHPAAARNRRLFRAIAPWLAGAIAAEVAGLHWLALGLLVLALLGVPLGLDRYRSLGHASDDERLSVRSGSLVRRQAVIERRAVVGWAIRQTWLQRRVGVVTLVAGVGAGTGGYAAVDVSEEEAARFAAEVTPSWVTGLLADEESSDRGGD